MIKRIKINRLFHGYCSLRDYQVNEAKRENADIIVEMEREYIIIPGKDLDKGYFNDEIFTSIHDPKLKYKLVDYDWKTYRPRLNPEQVTLF